jgi:hypothetical protein
MQREPLRRCESVRRMSASTVLWGRANMSGCDHSNVGGGMNKWRGEPRRSCLRDGRATRQERQ